MNIYKILSIPYTSNLLSICNSYQTKCQTNPENTFLYTKCLSILANSYKRLIYDANLFSISITNLLNLSFYNYQEIDEYDLLPFITWLDTFIDYFYDTKFLTQDTYYHNLIDNWYKEIITISDTLKSYLKTFYLI